MKFFQQPALFGSDRKWRRLPEVERGGVVLLCWEFNYFNILYFKRSHAGMEPGPSTIKNPTERAYQLKSLLTEGFSLTISLF